MNPLKNWVYLIPILLVGCASKGTVAKSDKPPTPPRPWQKVALKGVTQTSIEAFGSRMFVRVWPSKATPDATSALLDAVTEIKRIETMTNPGIENSEVARINRESWDHPVQISDELALVLQDCDRMHRLSEGKFDVLYVPYKGEKDYTDDDLNKIANWDSQPKLSPNPVKLFGEQGLLLDQNPSRVRRYNRRNRLNLNGMIRGYAIDRVTRLLADRKLAGFAVISDGLFGAAGIALQDPGLLCIENPQQLGKCLRPIKPTDPTKIFYFGASASLERRGEMYDPTSSWSYRSGGVMVSGPSAKWVQFATTYGAIVDLMRVNVLFEKSNGLGLSGVYFDDVDKTKLVGSLAPYATF